MASFSRTFPVAFAVVALTGIAFGQQPPPPNGGLPPGHPQMIAQPTGVGVPGRPAPMPVPAMAPRGGDVDCALTAMAIDVFPRRTVAMVDVTVKVRGVNGGRCVIRPAAIQITTLKLGGVSRPIAMVTIDQKLQKPVGIADSFANDHLRPWTDDLAANEERTITFREWVEGDQSPTGELDPPSRVRVETQMFGPRITDTAVIDAHFVADPKLRSRFGLNLGTQRAGMAIPKPTNDGKSDIEQVFSREGVTPSVEFKFDTDAPAPATRANLTDSLADLEFVRDTLIRDFAAALADPKDEKKIAAGWDVAMDSAMAEIRSGDPFIGAFGVRTLAWLASGLSTNLLTVHSDKDKQGEGMGVPSKIAAEADKAMAAYLDATGQKYAPSATGARSVRALVLKMGDAVTHRKHGEEGLKRLAQRVDDKKIPSVTFASFLGTSPAVPPMPASASADAKRIVFGPRGMPIFEGERVAGTGHSAGRPKLPIAARLVHAFTQRKNPRKMFFLFALLAGLGAGFAWFMGEEDKKKGDEEGDKLAST